MYLETSAKLTSTVDAAFFKVAKAIEKSYKKTDVSLSIQQAKTCDII